MVIVNLTLVTLELLAFVLFTTYVLRYSRYFIGNGPKRTYNLYLRSVWITYCTVALLCLNLLWGRLNIILGYSVDSVSNTLREFVLILTLILLVFAGLMHKDLWDINHKD